MLINKDYCDHDTCVALEELGFPRWMIDYVIPEGKNRIHFYDIQRWLREERSLFIEIHKILYGGYSFHVLDLTTYTEESRGQADGYEEALFKGIKDAIKLLKKEKYPTTSYPSGENAQIAYRAKYDESII